MSIKVYIAAHKKFEEPNKDIYIPLHVGAENKNDLGYLKDSTSDNISLKNPNFCELTGLYWMWKNSDADIIGLVHYRRYFFKNWKSHKLSEILSENDIKEILNDYDIILPKKIKISFNTVESFYEKIHNIDDYKKCRKIILNKYPEYIDSFDKFSKSRSMYAYNMFICNKKIMDEYCKWLFDILFELEKQVNISSYDDYNKRIFGFLSERLFNVWIMKNNLKIKELNVYNVDDSYFKQLSNNVIKGIFMRG